MSVTGIVCDVLSPLCPERSKPEQATTQANQATTVPVTNSPVVLQASQRVQPTTSQNEDLESTSGPSLSPSPTTLPPTLSSSEVVPTVISSENSLSLDTTPSATPIITGDSTSFITAAPSVPQTTRIDETQIQSTGTISSSFTLPPSPSATASSTLSDSDVNLKLVIPIGLLLPLSSIILFIVFIYYKRGDRRSYASLTPYLISDAERGERLNDNDPGHHDGTSATSHFKTVPEPLIGTGSASSNPDRGRFWPTRPPWKRQKARSIGSIESQLAVMTQKLEVLEAAIHTPIHPPSPSELHVQLLTHQPAIGYRLSPPPKYVSRIYTPGSVTAESPSDGGKRARRT